MDFGHENYECTRNLQVTVGKETSSYAFEAYVLGDFVIAFDIAAPACSITGELGIEGGGTPAYVLKFTEDGRITTYLGEDLTSYGEISTNIAVRYRVDTRCFDYYVDGEPVLSGHSADREGMIPINFDKCVTFHMDFSAVSSPVNVKFDRILAYPAYAKVDKAPVYDPACKPIPREKKIILTEQTTIPSDKPQRELLEGAVSLHMRTGVVYKDGKKEILHPLPCLERDQPVVPAEYSKKYVFYDTTTTHSGMVILTDEPFAAPEGEELQQLNDFCCFYRPDKEKLLADFQASPLCGVHPRIMATAEDFARIRRETETNEIKKAWKEQLLLYCEELLSKETLKYELRDGVRLLYVSWDCENYLSMLAMAYQLTGDRKYFDCAWKHMESIANMPDWNPSHHIDVGVMARGVALAYDWFYEIMTEKQRRIMERGMYNNCLWTVNRAVEDANTPYCSVNMQNNHNVFVNAGNMAVCMALMDVYPAEASKVGADILRVLEFFLDKFAPDGAYYEGPYYAEVGIDYTVRLFAAMYPSLGTLYGLDKAQGFDKIADFMNVMQSDVSAFNFADSRMGLICPPGLFWMYEYYGLKGYKDNLAMGGLKKPKESFIVESLLWYSVREEEKDSESVVRDRYYSHEDIIAMHNHYNPGQVFVGIKAGDTVYAHSHMDAGSFVFDACGKRWAFDFGQDDYNLYYKYNPWNVFRLRAESHNTLLIDPDAGPGYVIGSRADVLSYESKPEGVITKIDMTRLYGEKVENAKRGYFFTDNRQSLVVRDQIIFAGKDDPSEFHEAYWLMYMDSEAQIQDNNTVILTDKQERTRKLKVEFLSSGPGEIRIEEAKPFPTSPVVPGQEANEGFYRLMYKVCAAEKVTITAKLTPLNREHCPGAECISISNVIDYDRDMDLWSI